MIESPIPPYLQGEELTSLGNAIASLVDKIVHERLKTQCPDAPSFQFRPQWSVMMLHALLYMWFGDGTLRKHMVGGRVYCFIEDFERQKTREKILGGKRGVRPKFAPQLNDHQPG